VVKIAKLLDSVHLLIYKNVIVLNMNYKLNGGQNCGTLDSVHLLIYKNVIVLSMNYFKRIRFKILSEMTN